MPKSSKSASRSASRSGARKGGRKGSAAKSANKTAPAKMRKVLVGTKWGDGYDWTEGSIVLPSWTAGNAFTSLVNQKSSTYARVATVNITDAKLSALLRSFAVRFYGDAGDHSKVTSMTKDVRSSLEHVMDSIKNVPVGTVVMVTQYGDDEDVLSVPLGAYA